MGWGEYCREGERVGRGVILRLYHCKRRAVVGGTTFGLIIIIIKRRGGNGAGE